MSEQNKISKWHEAQKWEKEWHGNCVNKVLGEYHQIMVIAPKMGLTTVRTNKNSYTIDMKNKSVLDIGGGSASLLLQCINVRGKVVDPIKFPDWTYARYDCAGIDWEIKKGEDVDETGYDEVFIYNCLQHVEDPKKIIFNAKKAGKLIRIFEYINIPICAGHIHTLKESELNQWLGGEGKVEENKRYYGIFPSNINSKEYWDKIYRHEGKDTWRVKKELNDFVLSKIKGSVLELGCGVGILAKEIKGEYLGLDISSVAVQIMHEQGFKAEIRNIPSINTKKFDTIVGLELLEHLDKNDRLETIIEANKLCNQAIFSVPNNCMSPEDEAEHRVMFNEQSFKKFLEKAFTNVEIIVIDEYLVGICG